MTGVEKFLGSAAAAGGPFALLGVAPEHCTNAAVIAALEFQLDRIDQHPQGDTPEAEEVRLAVHVAAAQLLDPTVRRHLLQRVRPGAPLENGAPASPSGAQATQPAPAPATSAAVLRLEQDAILTLARFGGINAQSMRRMAALAHARGLDAAHAAEALQHLARRRPLNVDRPAQAGGAAAAPAQRISPETAEVLERVRRTRAWQAAIVASMLILSLISLAVLVAVIVARAPSRPRAVAQEQVKAAEPLPRPAAPKPGEEEAAPEPDAPPLRPLITAGPEMLEAFRSARAALDADPEEALDQFAYAVASLAANWPGLTDGQRRAAHHALLEFLYASSPWPEIRDSAFNVVARPAARLADGESALEAGEVAPAVWSVGMLTRLADERELSVQTTTAIRRSLIEALGSARAASGSFEDGARAASALVPLAILRTDRLTESAGEAAQAIESWTRVAIALDPDRTARERILAAGLERILIEAAEPSDDPRVLAAIRALINAIPFSPEGPARARLVDWFRHPRITSDDMAEVTGALLTTAVEGLDSTMVLSRTAGRDDRLAMARAYAQAWKMEQAAVGDELAQRWIETARNALAEHQQSAEVIDYLDRTVNFARLNEVARRIWRGERSGLGPVLDAVQGKDSAASLANAIVVNVKYSQSSLGNDGQWALRYRAARQNIPVRLELLDEIARAGSAIGPIDAEVLAEEAFFGTPTDRIRPRAQEIAVQFADDPAMVLAILEVLPRRRTMLPDMARMVSSLAGDRLGDPESPAWTLRARRALVRRAVELLAPESSSARIDPLAAALSASYRRRAGVGDRGQSGPVRAAIAAEELLLAARELWEVVLLEADALAAHDEAPVQLDAVERRRRGRQTLARGPTQLFVAEQVSIAEVLAWTVSGEHRSRAADVEKVMSDMTAARQSATQIYQQAEAAERAMLQLWLIRFGEEVTP